MFIIIRLILESFRFAWSALKMNAFRTTLSLLGVTIGIFSIIGVFTLVDSLEDSIKSSLDFLGTGVVYIQKQPFMIDSREMWMEVQKRPNVSYTEYRLLEKVIKDREAMAIMSGAGASFKYKSNTFNNGVLYGGSYEYKDVFNLAIEKGRYFTRQESESGRSVIILGYTVADKIFGKLDPLGKKVTVKGRRFVVIGVIEEEGESFLGGTSNDENGIVPYNAYRKLISTGTGRVNENGSAIAIKGSEKDVGLVELEYQVKGLLRSRRGLKPDQEDDFAINRPEAIMNSIGGVFDILTVAGWIIGGFSILVGGFGIANIMFVSVKERTSIIGIQKSLGAKNYFILFQFLFESIFLSVIGGAVGLLLVYLLSFLSLGSLDLTLTFGNVVLGLGVASIIGTVSGIVPAAIAARLDPVMAIRS